MSLSISQMAAASYDAVLNESRKAENQWVSNAAMAALEKGGFIIHKSLSETLEYELDYRRNPGAKVLTTELESFSTAATEILTAAQFTPAEIVVPVTWSKRTETLNPSTNQKIPIVKSLLTNGFDSHDNLIEEALFDTTTQGLLGLKTHAPTSGQGSDGGIDSMIEAFWRLAESTYTDETDMETSMTTVWNTATKGSGDTMSPTLIISDADTQAIFEGSQQGQQRYVDSQDLKAGFKTLAFKTSRYIFSQFADTNQYFLNPKAFQLCVSKESFREKGDTNELPDATGYRFWIYSALQTVVSNRSRLGVNHL